MPEHVRWVVQPELVLDALAPVSLSRGLNEERYNTYGMVSPDGWSVAMRDGKYGLLDHDGQWVAPCEYSSITCGYNSRYLLTRSAEGQTTEYTFDDAMQLRAIAPGETNPDGSGVSVSITGTAVNPTLCWVADQQILCRYADASVDALDSTPDYPVRALWLDSASEEGIQELWTDEPHDVLINNGRPVGKMLYQNLGCMADGVIPACSDGKWGYLDAQGETVFPFEYDANWPELQGVWRPIPVFNATDGTLVLCRDGAYALYTVTGEELIPFGAFEQLLPVHEGRLWARQDGKWGVLELVDSTT